MTKNTLISVENKLHELKGKTDDKIWQYVVLREFIDLFSENNQVIRFIASEYGRLNCFVVDDSALLKSDELATYERGEEKTLEEKLFGLLGENAKI